MDTPLNKVLTNAPPPPPAEVKIRTMRSDIESMMRSGGGAPSFQNVAVSGLALEREGYKAPIIERTPIPAPTSFSIPAAPVVESSAASNVTSVPASGSIAPDADLPAVEESTPEAAPENHLMPILIVTLVAILAIAVVGYFAYTLFK
jgi:hypothetical protein